MSETRQDYTSYITSEHQGAPNFLATVTASTAPFAAIGSTLASLQDAFDLDSALGVQLDAVGLWIGVSRYVNLPVNVYFSFNIAGLGFNQGIWYRPGDATSVVASLPDDVYRTLLKARIIANNWDGTAANAVTAWQTLFQGEGFSIVLQDLGTMTAVFVLTGNKPDPTTQALFESGELNVQPLGVTILLALPSAYPAAVPGGTPLFGLGVDNATIGGLGHGALVVEVKTA